LARSLYYGQKAKGISIEANHRNIVSEFEAVEKNNGSLSPTDLYAVADSLIELGKTDEGLERAANLPESERTRKFELYRRVIDRSLKGAKPDQERALNLLGEMLADRDLPISEQVWATARQARVLSDKGFTEEAINKLLRALPRLTKAEPAELGELYLMLGRAYMQTGDIAEAGKQFERAGAMLDDNSDVWGEVQLCRARIEESQQKLEDAKGRYGQLVTRFAGTSVHLPALLGFADTLAAMEQPEESLESYSKLVDAMAAGKTGSDINAERVKASLMARFNERYNARQTGVAIQFADLAERLFDADELPDDVAVALGRAHRRLAEEALGIEDADSDRDGPRPDAGSGTAHDLEQRAKLDAATLQQAQKHFVYAGRYFRRHANKAILTDPREYAQSLWAAADAFDRSGNQEDAIAAFLDYLSAFPSDARASEAKFRLARAYQSRGDLEQAGKLYRELTEQRSDAGGGPNSGLFADASFVPLAQTYLMDAVPENDVQAEQILAAVAGGQIGGTDSANFRLALLELGRVYYQTRNFERGIERLEEVVQRYPGDAELDQVRYRLADCYRLSSRQIDQRLREAMPDSERKELEEQRATRVARARDLFEAVRDSIDAKDVRRRTALEETQLRNAYFYLGDCAFDLRDYEAAIRYYDAARERYPKDPASLVAMVQIVSAHLEQGDMRRAMTANERAKRFFASLPPSVWDDPNLPMTRRDWERWLDATSKLATIEAEPTAEAAPGESPAKQATAPTSPAGGEAGAKGP
jgi:tetratricopeptide (TPR) repeat protein